MQQFYPNSTPVSAAASPHQQPPSDPKTLPIIPEDQPVCFYLYNQYYHQFLQLSNQLNQQLLINHSLIELRTNPQEQPQPV